MSIDKIKGLYVNHKKQRCGVYEFGKEIGDLLCTSNKFEFSYCECDSLDELRKVYKKIRPQVIVYNYHPSTMPWVRKKGRFSVPLNHQFQAIHIGTIHEVHQEAADKANKKNFDFHIGPDPTLMLKNPIVYKTGRLLPQKGKQVKDFNKIPVIGSFGFATPGKGFEKIIDLVQNEFDAAIIKLNIPFARFGDRDGEMAREIAERCKERINKKSIQLEIDHNYLDKEDLILFLSSNSINVFLYDDMKSRGISSATDWALASGRPIAISKSRLFRHLFNCKPSICVEINGLKSILANDTNAIKHLYDEYSSEVILWEYEKILEDVFTKLREPATKLRTPFRYYFKKIYRLIGSRKSVKSIQNNKWTKPDDRFIFNEFKEIDIDFSPINLQDKTPLNRILDNNARSLYKPVIDFLFEQFPDLIAKKIPEANIQQAFVLDTTVRLSREFIDPRILAVGSYEDTAVEALKLLNYEIDDIDPILNYDLGTFKTKPTTKAESYDLIISTSVIEHVFDDEQFIKDIEYLLKRGGYGILTCDYKDQYVKGEEIPSINFRFYTQKDIKDRLIKAIPSCHLLDSPEWNCEKPDFILAGKYNYTFASIVIQKAG